MPPELIADLGGGFDARWGNDEEPMSAELLAPSLLRDDRWRRSLARMQRLAGNPRSQHQYFQLWANVDVRDVLPAINVPTMVLGCTGDLLYPVAQTRYVAARIKSAKYSEFAGTDHLYWAQNDRLVADEIEEFITGDRHADDLDRILATVLFTDIVGSTEIAAEVGDRRWAELVEAHHRIVRRQLDRFRGREVDTAGDGFFATFDGPARAIRCVQAIGEELRSLGLRIRAGLHTGECEVMDNKVGGIAVNVGARVAGHADADEILVSRTVVDLVAGSGIKFSEHGEHQLKGVPGAWLLYRVD
jgi:class 3 adenylate cyclase